MVDVGTNVPSTLDMLSPSGGKVSVLSSGGSDGSDSSRRLPPTGGRTFDGSSTTSLAVVPVLSVPSVLCYPSWCISLPPAVL